jgi:hypothetical protein
MKIVIDRFEGDYAVVELPDGKVCNMPICLVPEVAGEGDIIEIVHSDDNESREKQIRKKMDNLFNR